MPPAPRPVATAVHRATVVALPLVVLVQAVLAGQHLYDGADIALHGILGNVTFALAVVNAVLVIARGGDGVAFGLAVALGALAFAQVGLGYVGRDTAAAAAWHIPLGVAIFGLACAQATLLLRRS